MYLRLFTVICFILINSQIALSRENVEIYETMINSNTDTFQRYRMVKTIEISPSEEVVSYVSNLVSDIFERFHIDSVEYKWFQDDKIVMFGGPRVSTGKKLNDKEITFPLVFTYMGKTYCLGEVHASGRMGQANMFRLKLLRALHKGE